MFVEENQKAKVKADMSARERRLEKKRKIKERFDMEYDGKGDNAFYETWKSEADEQAKVSLCVS